MSPHWLCFVAQLIWRQLCEKLKKRVSTCPWRTGRVRRRVDMPQEPQPADKMPPAISEQDKRLVHIVTLRRLGLQLIRRLILRPKLFLFFFSIFFVFALDCCFVSTPAATAQQTRSNNNYKKHNNKVHSNLCLLFCFVKQFISHSLCYKHKYIFNSQRLLLIWSSVGGVRAADWGDLPCSVSARS